MGFMDAYGPGAPLVERLGYGEHRLLTSHVVCSAQSLTIRLGWFGAVGRIVGLVCGIAFFGLLLAMVFSLYPTIEKRPSTEAR
jgi:hypothetical protein